VAAGVYPKKLFNQTIFNPKGAPKTLPLLFTESN
jgi:hypothetical protein